MRGENILAHFLLWVATCAIYLITLKGKTMKKVVGLVLAILLSTAVLNVGALPHDDGGGASDHPDAAIINAGNGSPVAGARFCHQHQNGRVWELRQSYHQSGVVQIGVVSTHDAKWQCEAQLR